MAVMNYMFYIIQVPTVRWFFFKLNLEKTLFNYFKKKLENLKLFLYNTGVVNIKNILKGEFEWQQKKVVHLLLA